MERVFLQLLVFGEDSILLPNPTRSDTKNVANWIYLDLAPQVPQEKHAQVEDIGDD